VYDWSGLYVLTLLMSLAKPLQPEYTSILSPANLEENSRSVNNCDVSSSQSNDKFGYGPTGVVKELVSHLHVMHVTCVS
jgi:hypothetical protein